MRSTDQIKKIQSKISDPYSVENFLTEFEVQHLISLYENHQSTDKIYKNTGPITLNINHYLNDEVVSSIIYRLQNYIGIFEITAAFFFQTNVPHVIHNDDTFELSDVYKGITIPLKLFGKGEGYPKLCFFDQFYFHGPAKFFYGSKNIPTYYNKQVYNYDQIDNIAFTKFIDHWNYFTHLKPQWLTGLSLNSAKDWKPTSALIFDSVRLHCASDFRNLGYSGKLGLSIFTKIPS
jgi:hypothetical protein